MSRIYFHSQDGTAEVRGSERAHAGVTCANLALVMLHLDPFRTDRILQFVKPDHYLHTFSLDQAMKSFETCFAIGELTFNLPDGTTADAFTVGLDTCLTLGSDVVKFLARLHGQCEIHGYVEGANRRWFSDIVDQGLDDGLLRRNAGWESVVKLLLSADNKPVVTSYSVCDGFPNANGFICCAHCGYPKSEHVVNPSTTDPDDVWFVCPAQSTANVLGKMLTQYVDGNGGDSWYKLTPGEQWRLALQQLRMANEAAGLEWRPDNWQTFQFQGVTAMSLRAMADAKA